MRAFDKTKTADFMQTIIAKREHTGMWNFRAWPRESYCIIIYLAHGLTVSPGTCTTRTLPLYQALYQAGMYMQVSS